RSVHRARHHWSRIAGCRIDSVRTCLHVEAPPPCTTAATANRATRGSDRESRASQRYQENRRQGGRGGTADRYGASQPANDVVGCTSHCRRRGNGDGPQVVNLEATSVTRTSLGAHAWLAQQSFSLS